MSTPDSDGLNATETAHVLDYLRGMDHSVLDARYEVESCWRDLRATIIPLAKVFAIQAAAKTGDPPEIHRLQQRAIAGALEEARSIVEHYTTGAPLYLLQMEEGDQGWPEGDQGWPEQTAGEVNDEHS